MTLQTFAIPLAGVVLGRKNGTIAALVYILLGIAGVPVFAGFTGGIGMLFSKTGGFIISFPLMALTAGIGAKKNLVKFALWLTAGSLINYISGLLVFSMVHFGNLGAASLWASFAMAVAPFIPTAVIKIIMVLVSGRAIKRALRRNF
jgi:biotin transport system substrate-specific component